ncbi:MAG: hypothetical protein QOI70_663 [Microbacteriaceae bacterium]|jgi:uncharacterized protein YcnI|nr:hypothetical protein [Microbacteriaceae bacterium]
MNLNTPIKVAVAIGAGALLAIAVPIAASAHVTITPYGADPGSYSIITFAVPNESSSATTTKLEVDIPTGTPFASVSYIPVSGWSTDLVSETLPKPVTIDHNQLTTAVTRVIWTADAGSEIRDGQLRQFSLSVGPVPNTGKIRLPATQTYSDGTVVRWNESGSNSQHPAPVLYVNDAPVASTDADAEVTAAMVADATPPASGDPIARALGIGGLVVGTIGIVLAVTARRPRSKPRGGATRKASQP